MAAAPVTALVVAILALGLVLLGGGALATLQWLRVWRRRRERPARQQPGLVALQGTCLAAGTGEPAPAPLSAVPACWSVLGLERDAGDVSRSSWRPEAREERAGDFRLETPAGTVRVDPADAIVDLGADETVALDPDAEPATLRDALGSLDVDLEDGRLRVGDWGLDSDEHYRLVERRLEPGDEVSVTGRLEPGGDAVGTIDGPATDTWRSRLFSVPFVVADEGGESASHRLRNRALVGFVFGLPPTLLALVLLFPPGGGG
jgi:hypothetical protein